MTQDLPLDPAGVQPHPVALARKTKRVEARKALSKVRRKEARKKAKLSERKETSQ